MSPHAILDRAAAMLADPAVYERRYAGSVDGRQVAVCDPRATAFSLSGLIERAASSAGKGLYLMVRDPAALNAARAILCRHLGTVHLYAWEIDAKPDATMVRRMLIDAGK